MTPGAIVSAARARGLDWLALCDHNSARNAAAVAEAAAGNPAVTAGIEITTAEEVHVLGLFPDPQAASAAGAEVGRTLPPNTPEAVRRFGEQHVLAADGRTAGREERMLCAASMLDLSAAVALIHRCGGLAVAAHVDRPSFSVFAQLGVYPAAAGFDAVEISAANASPPWAAQLRALPVPVLRGSDAHFLSAIGDAATRLRLEQPTLAELRLALAGYEGRAVLR
jgi:predicted metal-dependent phosphoesterase TrpH